MKKLCVLVLGIALALSVTVSAEGYRTSIGTGADEIPVVVVKGTPFEMGRAMGALLKEEAVVCIDAFLAGVREKNAEMYTDEKLDAAWEAIAPYTDPRFLEEMRGVAEGAGISLDHLIRTHMIPIVSPWACSCVAVWGKQTKSGGMYQIRNLDFMTEVGLQNTPAVVVYLPDKGFPHACPTFAGYVAANSGMNTHGICLSEKGNSPGDGYPYDTKGTHFSTLFRRLLYDARSLDDVRATFDKTQWFKSYYFVVGSAEEPAGMKVKVDAPKYETWGGNDPTDENHPNVLEDAVYITMEDPDAYAFLTEHQRRTGCAKPH